MNIHIDQLAIEVTMAVKEYTDDVSSGVIKEADKSSKQLVKEIQNDSPKRTEKYAKGWTRKKAGYGGEIEYTVYNKRKPGLTHLLEKGHAKRGGGRVAGKPHIAPATDRITAEFERKIASIIRNGG